MDRHLTSLDCQEFLICHYEEDGLVTITEQSGLIAFINDSESECASRFHRTLRWHASESKIELGLLFDSLDVGH